MLENVANDVQFLPLSYDVNNSEASARELLFALRPEWKTSDGPLEFVRFKDGITNTLFKAIKKRPGLSEQQIDQEAILLRAYGNGTAVLIDREREALSHSLLARKQLAPPLLARFQNGLLYRFIEGTPCTPADLRKEEIWPAIARKMAEWHAILPTSETTAACGEEDKKWVNINKLLPDKPIPNVWTIMAKWIDALPSKTEEEKKRNSTLRSELHSSTDQLGNAKGLADGLYVLAHCDLLSGNVIIHPQSTGAAESSNVRQISFIDYEYATPGSAAFDLANHFAEWGGFECDFNVLPTVSQRKIFIKNYVDSYRIHKSSGQTNGYHKEDDKAPDQAKDVETLMAEVDKFRGIPGLYWGIWALIQATISQIDFDYASYADIRLGEYWAWKAEQDGSRKEAGKEMPLRERRWAQDA